MWKQSIFGKESNLALLSISLFWGSHNSHTFKLQLLMSDTAYSLLSELATTQDQGVHAAFKSRWKGNIKLIHIYYCKWKMYEISWIQNIYGGITARRTAVWKLEYWTWTGSTQVFKFPFIYEVPWLLSFSQTNLTHRPVVSMPTFEVLERWVKYKCSRWIVSLFRKRTLLWNLKKDIHVVCVCKIPLCHSWLMAIPKGFKQNG